MMELEFVNRLISFVKKGNPNFREGMQFKKYYERKKGYTFSISEHLSGIIYSLLSN